MTELSVLHVLPHGGGGGERYIELLADRLPWRFETIELADSAKPASALPRMIRTLPRVRLSAARYELVNVHGDTAALLIRPFLRERPWIITTHGLSLLRRQRGLWGAPVTRAIRSAVRAADLTVCTSIQERRELDDLIGGAAAERLVTIPNGVELPPPVGVEEQRASRIALGMAEDEVAVLLVGDLSSHKDPLTAVKMAERLRENGMPIRLLIAGDGDLRAEIEAIESPSVTVLGHQDDVRPLYAAGEVLVLPSRREGSSLVLLEAMAHGVPAVVSSGPGNAEAVGDAGIVVPVGDVGAFVAAVMGLWRSPAERERLGARARRRVAERYTVERVADQWLSVLRRVTQDGMSDPGRAHEVS